MSHSLVVAKFPAVTGITADVSENVLVFEEDPAVFLSDVAPGITGFYTDTQDTGYSITSFMAQSRSRASNVASLVCYELVDLTGVTDLGPPVSMQSFTIDAPGNTTFGNLPDEVAIAISMQADITGIPESIANPAYPPDLPKKLRPASRRRGRLYIGPLSGYAASTNEDTFEVEVNMNCRETFLQAAQSLALFGGTTWSVWSRRDATLYPVNSDPGGSVWVDNAFDSQRRRGQEATLRTRIDF